MGGARGTPVRGGGAAVPEQQRHRADCAGGKENPETVHGVSPRVMGLRQPPYLLNLRITIQLMTT